MTLSVSTIHRGALLEVFDCACRTEHSAFGKAEDVDVTQLVIARSGHFVRRVGRREVGHEAGSASVFLAGESHAVGHPHAGGDRCVAIVPTERVLEPLLDASRSSARQSIPLQNESSYLLARFSTAARDRRVDALELEETAIGLYSAIIATMRGRRACARPRAASPARDHIVERARDVLAATFREHADLATIAERAGASPFHLCRVFKATTGRTLAHHRLALRLVSALEAIESGADDLTSLALSLGFADHSHFTNSFRRAFGVAPSKVRTRPDRAELRALSNRLQAGVRVAN